MGGCKMSTSDDWVTYTGICEINNLNRFGCAEGDCTVSITGSYASGSMASVDKYSFPAGDFAVNNTGAGQFITQDGSSYFVHYFMGEIVSGSGVFEGIKGAVSGNCAVACSTHVSSTGGRYMTLTYLTDDTLSAASPTPVPVRRD